MGKIIQYGKIDSTWSASLQEPTNVSRFFIELFHRMPENGSTTGCIDNSLQQCLETNWTDRLDQPSEKPSMGAFNSNQDHCSSQTLDIENLEPWHAIEKKNTGY